MIKLSDESIRRKKRFLGDLETFTKQYGLQPKDVAEALGGITAKQVSQWLRRKSAPHLGDIGIIRDNMTAYRATHPLTAAMANRASTLDKPPSLPAQLKLLGVSLHIEGNEGGTTLSFHCAISMKTAKEIISHIAAAVE